MHICTLPLWRASLFLWSPLAFIISIKKSMLSLQTQKIKWKWNSQHICACECIFIVLYVYMFVCWHFHNINLFHFCDFCHKFLLNNGLGFDDLIKCWNSYMKIRKKIASLVLVWNAVESDESSTKNLAVVG